MVRSLPPPHPLEVSEAYHLSLLWRKLCLCSITLPEGSFVQGAPLATRQLETLDEIVSLCRSNGWLPLSLLTASAVLLTEKAIDDCFRFLGHVLFRPLPAAPSDAAPNEISPFRDPAFPLLSACYALLSALLALPGDALSRLLPAAFPRRLLRLLFAPDRRERRRAKSAVHHLYARLPDRRAALRRELQFLLLDAELAQADGVQEALEFYAGVLKGVTVPLRAEHRAFLQRCLLPLLKRPQLGQCFCGLDACFRVLVEKDGALGVLVGATWARHA